MVLAIEQVMKSDACILTTSLGRDNLGNSQPYYTIFMLGKKVSNNIRNF
jgi:hypothetical protein